MLNKWVITFSIKTGRFSTGGSIDPIISGSTFVVANAGSDPFGYGWSVAGVDQLVPVTGGIWFVIRRGRQPVLLRLWAELKSFGAWPSE
jgi:hypothetical protein